MTRYRVLRELGLDPVTAAIVAAGNWLVGVPRGQIRVLMLTIDYDS